MNFLPPPKFLACFLGNWGGLFFRLFRKKLKTNENIFSKVFGKNPKNRFLLHFSDLFSKLREFVLKRHFRRRFGCLRARNPPSGPSMELPPPRLRTFYGPPVAYFVVVKMSKKKSNPENAQKGLKHGYRGFLTTLNRFRLLSKSYMLCMYMLGYSVYR